METQKNDTIKCFCSVCNGETNHQVMAQESVSYSSEYDEYRKIDYYIVKCLGCEQIQFYQEIADETTYDFKENYFIEEPEKYTYPYSKKLVNSIDKFRLPRSLRILYSETMDCLNRKNFQLAGAGFRAIIEAVCLDKNITGSNLNSKINNLARQRIVTEKDKENLHAIRFLGNSSIHAIQQFEEKDLIIVAEIINTILTSLYVISEKVENLATKPITDFDSFLKKLKKGRKEIGVGKVVTFKNIVKYCGFILDDKLPEFENKLITLIQEGKYPALTLCPKQSPESPQQFKVESVD